MDCEANNSATRQKTETLTTKWHRMIMSRSTEGRRLTSSIYLPINFPRGAVLLEKLRVPRFVKKFPACDGTRRTFTTFTTSRQTLSLSWAAPTPVHALQKDLKFHFIIILHLRLGLTRGLSPSCVPTQNMYEPLVSHHTYHETWICSR